jgi:cytochrome c556
MTKRLVIIALAIAATSAALAHEDHEHATGVVRERMILMEQMGDRLLAITRRIRANKELDKVTEDAKVIEQLAAQVAAKFPPGSTQAPTAAKPNVWGNWPDFEAKAKKLEVEAAKLTQTSTANAAALRAQFRAVAFACDGCHEPYRVTKQ